MILKAVHFIAPLLHRMASFFPEPGRGVLFLVAALFLVAVLPGVLFLAAAFFLVAVLLGVLFLTAAFFLVAVVGVFLFAAFFLVAVVGVFLFAAFFFAGVGVFLAAFFFVPKPFLLKDFTPPSAVRDDPTMWLYKASCSSVRESMTS